jgi:hypothetical protein
LDHHQHSVSGGEQSEQPTALAESPFCPIRADGYAMARGRPADAARRQVSAIILQMLSEKV